MATVANLDDQLRRFVQCTSKYSLRIPRSPCLRRCRKHYRQTVFDPHINAAAALLYIKLPGILPTAMTP